MEEGRCAATATSPYASPAGRLGTRCEIKNVNSIRFVSGDRYEARRQIEVLEEGGTIKQETRLYDSGRGITRPMRSQEEAHDYRYFPDPDLLPLDLDPAWVEELKRGLPELPDAKKARFIAQYKLTLDQAARLVDEREDADEFEKLQHDADSKLQNTGDVIISIPPSRWRIR